MSVGKDIGFPGNAVPVRGEVGLQQDSSGADVMTLTLNSSVTSTAGGRALVIGRNNGADAISSVGELFSVNYDGIVEQRRHVVSLTTGSCAVTLSASQSGSFVVLGDCTGTDQTVTLPPAAKGLWYEFFTAAGAKASAATIAAATAGMIVCFAESCGADSIDIGGATGYTAGGSLRMISDGNKWYAITQPGMSCAAMNSATTACTLYPRTT